MDWFGSIDLNQPAVEDFHPGGHNNGIDGLVDGTEAATNCRQGASGSNAGTSAGNGSAAGPSAGPGSGVGPSASDGSGARPSVGNGPDRKSVV